MHLHIIGVHLHDSWECQSALTAHGSPGKPPNGLTTPEALKPSGRALRRCDGGWRAAEERLYAPPWRHPWSSVLGWGMMGHDADVLAIPSPEWLRSGENGGANRGKWRMDLGISCVQSKPKQKWFRARILRKRGKAFKGPQLWSRFVFSRKGDVLEVFHQVDLSHPHLKSYMEFSCIQISYLHANFKAADLCLHLS